VVVLPNLGLVPNEGRPWVKITLGELLGPGRLGVAGMSASFLSSRRASD